MNCYEYLKLPPIALLETLSDTFLYDIPITIETADDLATVSKMLSETANQYSFLCQLLGYAKIQKRNFARENSKTEKEDMIDREDVINNIVNAVKLRYNTLSRMITVKQEYNKELNINSARAG